MTEELIELVIPQEEAVFWMDAEGRWHNRHGHFEHKKIIAYFHSCIQKDEKGFFVSQIRDNIREKVYFRYAETAWFALNIQKNDTVWLILNTKAKIELDPQQLFIHNDRLYMQYRDGLIKFTEHAMMQLADMLDEDHEGHYYLHYRQHRYAISTENPPCKDDSSKSAM